MEPPKHERRKTKMKTHRRIMTGDIRKSTTGAIIATLLYAQYENGKRITTGTLILTEKEQWWQPVGSPTKIVQN